MTDEPQQQPTAAAMKLAERLCDYFCIWPASLDDVAAIIDDFGMKHLPGLIEACRSARTYAAGQPASESRALEIYTELDAALAGAGVTA